MSSSNLVVNSPGVGKRTSNGPGTPNNTRNSNGNLTTNSAPGSPAVGRDVGKFDMLMKVILIGDSGVGKSALLMRFSEDTFSQSFINTVGIDFKIKTMIVDDKKVKLQIYDTAGQERFRTITAAYYRGAQGVMLVYDVTDPQSFKNVRDWTAGMLEHVDQNVCKMIVVGNKCDLEDKKEVTEAKGHMLADEFGFKFIETSAKNGLRVDDAFMILVRDIKSRIESEAPKKESSKVDLTTTADEKSGGDTPKKSCRCGGK